MKKDVLMLAAVAVLCVFMILGISRAYAHTSDDVLMASTVEYTVIDMKYNEPVYFNKGGALVLLPNNQAVLLYNKIEVEEYAKIKEAAIYSETYKSEIGSVSDLTANAFIIRYEELGGKYKLKEVHIDGDM